MNFRSSMTTLLLVVLLLAFMVNFNTVFAYGNDTAISAYGYQPRPDSAAGDPSITIGAVGDCTLGSDDSFQYEGSFDQYAQDHAPDYFFSGVRSVLAEDDINLANLEDTLTTAGSRVDKSFQGDQAYFFRGSPSYAQILKDGDITAVSIANNHSDDYGPAGMSDTVSDLKSYGIGVFGYDQRYITTVNGITVGCLGYNDKGPVEIPPDLDTEKWELNNDIGYLRLEGCQLVVVFFHWGVEDSYSITDRQRELGHFAVDSGADLVLGAHPHVIEPIEQYRGRYIVYSLGNFCFGGNDNPSDKDTFIFRQTFNFENGELASAPIEIVPCSISSTGSGNDYRPALLSGPDAERVLSKVSVTGG